MLETLIPSDTPAEIVRLVEARIAAGNMALQRMADPVFDLARIQEANQEESAFTFALACHGYAEAIPLFCDAGHAYELDGPDLHSAAVAWEAIESGEKALDLRFLSRHDAAAATGAARRAWEAVIAQLPTD